MSTAEAWTIGRLLAWTQEYLSQQGADSPRLDAEVLLAHARRCRRIELYTAFDEEPAEGVRTAFRELVRRRAQGMPVAYLVGRREFYALDFRVTPDVLIPRPESEFLVIAALDALKRRGPDEPAPRLLDLGTGSGCLAVALAKHQPRLSVTAIDLSPQALALAEENARQHGLADRIRFVESDLDHTLAPGEQFDVIVSNPPYVSTAEMARLPRDVAQFEPRLALESGPTGLEITARIVELAPRRLMAGGRLFIETSPQLAPRAEALVTDHPEWEREPTVKDLAGLPRVIAARRR